MGVHTSNVMIAIFLALQDNGLGMGFMSNYIVLDMLKNLKNFLRKFIIKR